MLPLLDVLGHVVGQHHRRDLVAVHAQLAHLSVGLDHVVERQFAKLDPGCVPGRINAGPAAEDHDVELAVAHQPVAAVDPAGHLAGGEQAGDGRGAGLFESIPPFW